MFIKTGQKICQKILNIYQKGQRKQEEVIKNFAKLFGTWYGNPEIIIKANLIFPNYS